MILDIAEAELIMQYCSKHDKQNIFDIAEAENAVLKVTVNR